MVTAVPAIMAVMTIIAVIPGVIIPAMIAVVPGIMIPAVVAVRAVPAVIPGIVVAAIPAVATVVPGIVVPAVAVPVIPVPRTAVPGMIVAVISGIVIPRGISGPGSGDAFKDIDGRGPFSIVEGRSRKVRGRQGRGDGIVEQFGGTGLGHERGYGLIIRLAGGADGSGVRFRIVDSILIALGRNLRGRSAGCCRGEGGKQRERECDVRFHG